MINTDNTLLFATGNEHKRREFESLLGDFLNPLWRTFDLKSWPDQLPEVDEDQDTFWGNAVKKAFESSRHASSAALADDSGLVVDALDGRPGVHSARYAGEDATDEQNNRKLVDELQGVPEDERSARYVCVAALAIPNNKIGRTLIARTGVPIEEIGPAQPNVESQLCRVDDRIVIWFRGAVEGRIVDEPRGSHGFGYDPHFYVPEWDKTMAEVPLEKKNSISHRAEALNKMATFFHGEP